MAFSYVGSSVSPADNGTQDNSVARSIVGVSAVSGDLVYLIAADNSGVGTLSISATGGQTWNSLTAGSSGVLRRVFWCQFNGTWSADPSVVNSTAGTVAMTLYMVVFRPSSTPATLAVDAAISNTSNTAPLTPFDCTITGQTPTAGASTVTIAAWVSTDDNTWELQTGGWDNPGGVAQTRNLTGVDQSISIAYLIQGSAAATGDVVNRQLTNGGDVTGKSIVTFSEVVASGQPTAIRSGGVVGMNNKPVFGRGF